MTDGPALIALLGKPSDAPEVIDLLRQMSAKAPKLKKGDTTAHVDAEKLGLELTFSDEAYLMKRSDLAIGEGNLILTNIRFRAPEPAKAGYAGTLPHGVEFAKSQSDLQQLLGKPEVSNPNLAKDRWTIDGHWLFVRYKDDLLSVDNLGIQFLPPPKV
jgi:hypothetical protein